MKNNLAMYMNGDVKINTPVIFRLIVVESIAMTDQQTSTSLVICRVGGRNDKINKPVLV